MSRKQGHLSNPDKQARLRELEAQRERQLEEDLDAVLSTDAGRRFAWDVLDRLCNVFGGSFTDETHRTAFNEGRRSIGLDLIEGAKRVSPQLYARMVQDAFAAQAEDAERRRLIRTSTPDVEDE